METTLPKAVRRIRLGPATTAAAVLAALAAAVLILWWPDRSGAWIPSVVTGLLAVAVTLTFVEWTFRADAKARAKPLIRNASAWLSTGLEDVTAYVAADYAETHLADYAEVPDGLAEILDLWLANEETTDADRLLDDDGYPAPVAIALARLADFERVRDGYSDYLDENLAAELDGFVASLGYARAFVETGEGDPEAPRASMSTLVHATRALVLEFGNHFGELRLDEEYRSLIDGTRAAALERQGRS